jgi:hypothetical protein
MFLAACDSARHSIGSSGAPTRAAGIALARCMRTHGLRDFPDPIAGQAMQFNLVPGLNPASPAFQAARRACQNVVPQPSGAGPGVSKSDRAAALEHADCMRSHGIPAYPDPTYKNGRPTVEPVSNYWIATQSPAFLSAAKNCGGE